MKPGEPMTQTHKIVILEKQARQSILTGLLQQQSAIGDTNFVSLNGFLNSLVKDDRNADWFKTVSLLQKEIGRFDVLKTILSFPITAETLLSFIQTMADERWTVDDLPERNKKEKELKQAILLILSQEGLDRRSRQWEASHAQDLTHVELYEHFYAYPIQKRIDQWIKQGLTLQPFSNKTPNIKAYYTNNPRCEAQACVQAILEDGLSYDDQVIVCLDPALESQVETFLLQYEIPYFRVNEHKTNASFRLIQDLLKLKLEPTNLNLIGLIQNDLIDTQDRLSLIEYLQTFKFDVSEVLAPLTHVKTAFETSNIKDLLGGDKSTEKFERLEKKAERGLSKLREPLIKLMGLDSADYASFVAGLFDLYVGFFKNFTDEEIESINKVKQTLEQAQPYLKTMSDPYPFLQFALAKLTLSTKQTGGVILTDLKHAFIPNKKRATFLSCTQEFYPQNPLNNGLFDDEYRLTIAADAKERYTYHQSCLSKLMNSFDEVIYSMPLGGYDGKKKEAPNELSVYFDSNDGIAERWKLVEKERPVEEKPIRLSSATAEAIFFKEQELYGSVSSLEKYFHCPYQYFLTTGIGLRGAERYQIDSSVLGTLYHYILEKGIAEAKKNYAEKMIGHEASYVDPLFDDLKSLYPKQSLEIDLMRDRTIAIIRLSLEFLADREKNTTFVPYKVEENFNQPIDLGRKFKLHLNGFIDRIDRTQAGFVIIDYKSKTKNLSEAQVMVGLQLQLATYLWMCDQALDLGMPYGAYYFSFGQNNTSMTEFTYDLAPKTVRKNFDPQLAWFNGRRFNGWTTTPIIKIPDMRKVKIDQTDLTKIDQNASHTVSWKLKADGSYQTGPLYDPRRIYDHLENLYGNLIDDLSAAKIEKRNLGSSCQYCDFKHFCQFKGKAQKPPKVKKEDSILRAEQ
jgi:ATP-dependent helicase/nuclease subunit B